MSQTSTLKGQCIVEFLGTGLLIFFGVGCVAALKAAGASFGQREVNIIWGLGAATAIYLAARVSSVYLNPAVTIALWLFARFGGHKVVLFIISQSASAFYAAALVYGFHYSSFLDYGTTHHMVHGSVESLDLAGTFPTYPNPHINFVQAFAVETVITAILMGIILVLTDDGNDVPRNPLTPFLIGLPIAVIGAPIGSLTGFVMNPARNIGPKAFAWLTGWSNVTFTGGKDIPYFLAPLCASMTDVTLGAFSYHKLIGCRLSCDTCADKEQQNPSSSTTQHKALL